ncbi:MAG: hypothetical protein WCD43_13205 [Candidatus Acidiferrales bacterium]
MSITGVEVIPTSGWMNGHWTSSAETGATPRLASRKLTCHDSVYAFDSGRPTDPPLDSWNEQGLGVNCAIDPESAEFAEQFRVNVLGS